MIVNPNGITPRNAAMRSLMAKLEQETLRADSAEWNEEMYRIAFRYIKSHPLAKNLLPDLYEYMEEVLAVKRKTIINL